MFSGEILLTNDFNVHRRVTAFSVLAAAVFLLTLTVCAPTLDAAAEFGHEKRRAWFPS
jgi:hypothetical protein